MQLNQELIKQLSDQKYALDQAAIVAATDAVGTITYINEKFCEITGYTQLELIGQNHRIINSKFHSASFFAHLWKTITQGQVWRGEICNRKKNGNLYWVHTTIVPFLGIDEKPLQYLSIRYEITDLKEAQRLVLEQQAQLISASRLSAIGEMAAAITHEINNPLGVILGRVEMLKSCLEEQQLDRTEMKKLAEAIEFTGQRIAKIVHSMKTMAHHQDEEPTSQTFVQGLLDDAVDLCAHRFDKSEIIFRKPKISATLSVDCRSHQIVQVLINLFNNSFDAIHARQEKWVEIQVHDQPNMVQISVTDSGTAIHADVQKKMFNPFYSTKSVQYGTGLGLSISQSILQKNGGFLEYDSDCLNTRFTMGLPKHQPHLIS